MKLLDYRIIFHHEDNSREKEHYVSGPTLTHPITGEEVVVQFLLTPKPSFSECKIMSLTSSSTPEATLGTGKAVLHKGDVFDKETGRRLSLQRAMQNAGFDKEIRTQLWEAYRTSTPTPRWGH